VSLFKRGDVCGRIFIATAFVTSIPPGLPNRRQAETVQAKLKEEVNNRRFQIIESDPNITFGELAARFVGSGSARRHHPLSSEVPVTVLR